MDPRLHLFGIRHHGPGSAALLRQALDAVRPACVLIESAPEGESLIQYVADPDMQPPLAMLLYVADTPERAIFSPFAEFSPEWQAMCWALEHGRPVRFIDWPAAVSLACKPLEATAQPDALDLLAEAAGYEDGESFWNNLIEQTHAQQPLAVFSAIEAAMAAARAEEVLAIGDDNLYREAFMRTHLRAALKEYKGSLAVICGAWHVPALRAPASPTDDRALIRDFIRDMQRLKIEATWVPWTDSRLSARSGYGAGVVSPGWYRHLWSLYAGSHTSFGTTTAESFAARWQALTVQALRAEGYPAPTASAIEATRLSLALAALRGMSMPGLPEMRESALATLCHGNSVPLAIIEAKLYVGQRVGQIGERVPQNPLARDLAQWQRRTRLKSEDLEQEIRLDLRSEAGLLKSTLLHRLALLNVHWGKLLDAQAGRGTFREIWQLRWVPELSVALAEALIHGVTIESAAVQSTLTRAAASHSVTELAYLIQSALTADLPQAATACIALMQAAAVDSADLTILMLAVPPLVRVLRYGSARQLPEVALRNLIQALAVEINAGIRLQAQNLDTEAASAQLKAMEAFDEALTLFTDEALSTSWRKQLLHLVDDDTTTPILAGFSLRRLYELHVLNLAATAVAFSRHTSPKTPQYAGAFLEGFLRGGSEILLHDESLLTLLDQWLCGLTGPAFLEMLPLLRRSLQGFDATARRRLLGTLTQPLRTLPTQSLAQPPAPFNVEHPAFAAALPLLLKILGLEAPHG